MRERENDLQSFKQIQSKCFAQGVRSARMLFETAELSAMDLLFRQVQDMHKRSANKDLFRASFDDDERCKYVPLLFDTQNGLLSVHQVPLHPVGRKIERRRAV